jgi:hypothetical protein
MKHILERLDKPQLITVIEEICSMMVLDIDTDNDPGTNKPCVYASHAVIGTFTLLHLPAPLTITYRVTCVATETRRLVFEVDATSPQQAIDFAAQRHDEITDIESITDEFLGTEREDGWTAEPIS